MGRFSRSGSGQWPPRLSGGAADAAGVDYDGWRKSGQGGEAVFSVGGGQFGRPFRFDLTLADKSVFSWGKFVPIHLLWQ